jgi:hypothetical protein
MLLVPGLMACKHGFMTDLAQARRKWHARCWQDTISVLAHRVAQQQACICRSAFFCGSLCACLTPDLLLLAAGCVSRLFVMLVHRVAQACTCSSFSDSLYTCVSSCGSLWPCLLCFCWPQAVSGLRSLDLTEARELASLAPLSKLAGLSELVLTGCRKLGDLRPVLHIMQARGLKKP